MLRSFLEHNLNDRVDFQDEEIWIQQDSSTAHTTRQLMTVVREMFPERLIPLRIDDPKWPAPTPCSFFHRIIVINLFTSLIVGPNHTDLFLHRYLHRLLSLIGKVQAIYVDRMSVRTFTSKLSDAQKFVCTALLHRQNSIEVFMEVCIVWTHLKCS